SSYVALCALHSFPTRRSSDLFFGTVLSLNCRFLPMVPRNYGVSNANALSCSVYLTHLFRFKLWRRVWHDYLPGSIAQVWPEPGLYDRFAVLFLLPPLS